MHRNAIPQVQYGRTLVNLALRLYLTDLSTRKYTEAAEITWARTSALVIVGYGVRPYVTSSYRNIPYAQTSDLMVKILNKQASGAVHLIGNLAPSLAVYSSSRTRRDRPKSPTCSSKVHTQ